MALATAFAGQVVGSIRGLDGDIGGQLAVRMGRARTVTCFTMYARLRPGTVDTGKAVLERVSVILEIGEFFSGRIFPSRGVTFTTVIGLAGVAESSLIAGGVGVGGEGWL